LLRYLRLRAPGAAQPHRKSWRRAGGARLRLPGRRGQAGRIRDRDRGAVGRAEGAHRARQRRGVARPSPLTSQTDEAQMDERLLNPISTRELERRWTETRNGMAERKIDAMVMQNSNDWLGGHVRWFTDTPLSNGYPRSVIFPASDLMTVVEMGAK